MKVTTEALERCETLLTIEFDPAKEQDLLKKAANRISREVNIPGFRRGGYSNGFSVNGSLE